MKFNINKNLYIAISISIVCYFGSHYYNKIKTDKCFEEEVKKLTELTVDFKNFEEYVDKTKAQEKLIDQMVKVEILRIAPIKEQIKICNNSSNVKND